MSHELKEGVHLVLIAGLPRAPYGHLLYRVAEEGSGPEAVKSIVIAEQPGQMGMIPFAKVTFHDGQTSFHNVHNLETVVLPAEGEEDAKNG